ncbi:MAG: 6-phosphofructokinase [Planctomycetes bacterium]|nr:6-phosphofructokinase [Planctomycetota bacterium]
MDKLAILVGGGPAPGINGVIGSATIEAINSGLKVIGIYDGFKWLLKSDTIKTKELTISEISRIHFAGGSVLRTSRANPVKVEGGVEKVIASLKKLGIKYLITIGGDDTASSATRIAKQMGGSIQVVHVPKTIDNDLPLPSGLSSFGFQSARHFGTYLIQNLMEDAKTTGRWYITVTMGRGAGFLALGITFAAGATLAIIPEEFEKRSVTLKEICDILEGAIIKRKWMGRDDGVAVLAEGLAEKISEDELKKIGNIEYDEFGHVRLSELDLGYVVKSELQKRFHKKGDKLTIVNKTIGYELRSCAPIPFDIDYTRRLGYGAVRFLLSGGSNAMISYISGELHPIPLDEIFDKKTGRIKTRHVDINSEYYKAASSYMIKLKPSDFTDKEILTGLATTAGITKEEFASKFSYLVK